MHLHGIFKSTRDEKFQRIYLAAFCSIDLLRFKMITRLGKSIKLDLTNILLIYTYRM